MNGRKRTKNDDRSIDEQKMEKIYEKMMAACLNNAQHPFQGLLKHIEAEKRPILPTLSSRTDVYKTNPDRKKKPIELYLDTINTIYKKKDLDILINPLNCSSVFEHWAPRQVAIFQEGILKFGKQFQFIAELIESKNTKQVYEFYVQWKTTSHYKSFKAAQNAGNRGNLQDMI